jgi:hypothetical protein
VLRNQNAKLDANYHEKEKSLNCLKTRHAVLEQVGNVFCTKWDIVSQCSPIGITKTCVIKIHLNIVLLYLSGSLS